ncbi:hypothetical protein DSAG12_01995 [Promethearchaeum syntrophicum]|uniref:Uncharacterized protein n=1 Tax=Promethearchaeum syntrophicum TaxID=2594042 RepID=A0A5B9DBW1_9ARCH|nr:hypothetical protein [Candidatus Prometheoarchaeum syntrophicum]QEE16166.1 hypothetical protein DSAG12_01995 [Candidatus Prometheoarchaeum syntrophicum]
MDKKKIEKIGEKLNINSSEIEPKNSQNRLIKHLFWKIQVSNFVLSNLYGIFFGVIDRITYLSNYPYIYTNYYSTFSILGVSSINIANGIYTIPKRKNFNLNQIMRIGIYIINLIISFAVSRLLFLSIGSFGIAIKYGVYDSSKKK